MKIKEIQKNKLKNEVKKLRNKRLITITAMSEGENYIVLYQFDDKDIFMLKLKFLKKDHHVDSIIDTFPGADIMERELHDLFGIEFKGNPNMDHHLFLSEDLRGRPDVHDVVLRHVRFREVLEKTEHLDIPRGDPHRGYLA